MTQKTAFRVAWGLAAAVVVVTTFLIVEAVRADELKGTLAEVVNGLIDVLMAPVFALLGALIIARQPKNVIGWLLALPALASVVVSLIGRWTASFESAPAEVSVWLLLALWLQGWSWLLFIFPIFHLLQVFPTGRVLSPKWRWLMYVEIGMAVAFVGLISFSTGFEQTAISSDEALWQVENPIGFIGPGFWEGPFSAIWSVGLLVLVVGGGASTVIRFRRSRGTERQQLKWLLFALILFAAVYAVSVVVVESSGLNPLLDLLFLLSVLSIPVAMTISVLRYRLFDIDLIIRKTLVYGLLTGLLTAVYFGSVVLLQSVFRGEGSSSITVAASTLLITASFTPLRRRIQSLIDRRLFRSKYNAQMVIERFGGAAQHQANLETLSADLMAVVGETIQPRSGVLWIKEPTRATAR